MDGPRKTKVLVILAVPFVAAVVAVVVWPHEKEPVYKGKKLSEWMEIASSRWQSSEGVQACLAIREIGTNGVPYLTKWITSEPAPLPDKVRELSTNLPAPVGRFVRGALGPDGAHRARVAGYALGTLGPRAAPAVPKLIPLMNCTNPIVCGRAMGLIAATGEPGITPLLEVLANEHHPNRAKAVVFVVGAHKVADRRGSVVPVLVRCLIDKDSNVASNALVWLPGIGRPKPFRF